MKTLSAMEMRKHFGAVVDEVRLKSETFILERGGKPVAVLKPLSAGQEEDDGVSAKIRAINQFAGLGRKHKRSGNLAAWLRRERTSWEK